MSVLAIDTASRRRGLCVLAEADGRVLGARALTGRDLDRELPAALAALLDGGVTAVACVLGPGSYTGLRVGIGAALGVAHARGLPLHGMGALDVVALAAPSGGSDVEAVADAGRGALYVARFGRSERGALRPVDAPRRVGAAEWTPAAGVVAVSFDGVAGTLDVSESDVDALAAAAAQARRRPPLPRAGLEPVYLGSPAAHARQPRV